jgi:hypothetical protein
MLRDYKTILGTILLLFSMQNAQATPVVASGQNFDLIDPGAFTGLGDYTLTGDLPDSNPNVLWFQFTLTGPAIVSLDTAGSSIEDPLFGGFDDDTILALYDSSGSIEGENRFCPTGGATELFSCLDLSLAGGLYFVGVTNWFGEFSTDFGVGGTDFGDGDVNLNLSVSAIPVPAAVWLFGTALIGFIGMSRRTSIKT